MHLRRSIFPINSTVMADTMIGGMIFSALLTSYITLSDSEGFELFVS